MLIDAGLNILGLPDVDDGTIRTKLICLVSNENIDPRMREIRACLNFRPAVSREEVSSPGPIHSVDDTDALRIA